MSKARAYTYDEIETIREAVKVIESRHYYEHYQYDFMGGWPLLIGVDVDTSEGFKRGEKRNPAPEHQRPSRDSKHQFTEGR